MADSFTLVLCGPERTKRPFQVALERAGAVLETPDTASWHGFPAEDGDGWLRVLHSDINVPVELGARFEWRLRAHHHTPVCWACRNVDLVRPSCLHCGGRGVTNRPLPKRDLAAEIDELRLLLAAKGA